MSEEKLIADFLQQVAESRATGKPPATADGAIAQLIGIVGKNAPLKPQAVEALTQCDWPLALHFLSALTPPGMVFIPAGEFTLGSDESDEEKPPHKVWLNSYYIDRTPVTNAQFAEFWEDVSYAESSDAWKDFEEARELIYKQQLRRAPYYWFDTAWNQPERPLVGVNWYEAIVYARWAGKRLPSEAEWEKAARGRDARRYPWGDDFDPTRCNTNLAESPANSTTEPGRFSPQGNSPYGVQDMAGNVWEWTSSAFRPYPYQADESASPASPLPPGAAGAGGRHGREDLNLDTKRVLRGGGFRSYFTDHYRCAYRYAVNQDHQYFSVGFRCAATVPPQMRM